MTAAATRRQNRTVIGTVLIAQGATAADDRTTYIGGSDVAGILGIPMYHANGERAKWSPTPYSVWAEKVGALKPEPSTARLDAGTDAELFLKAQYERKFPRRFVIGEQRLLTHPDYPWLRGHQDGEVSTHPDPDIGETIAGWEGKTTVDLTPWSTIPEYYQCQAQTYMILSGLREWHFTVGFGRWQVEHYVVRANDEDQALILTETERFWNDHVVTGDPPEVDGYPATTDAIKRSHNVSDPDDVMWCDEELQALVAEARSWQAQRKHAEQQCELYKNRIKARMEDCGELRDGTDVVATWKPVTARRIDPSVIANEAPDLFERAFKESNYRTFLLKGGSQ